MQYQLLDSTQYQLLERMHIDGVYSNASYLLCLHLTEVDSRKTWAVIPLQIPACIHAFITLINSSPSKTWTWVSPLPIWPH